MYGPTQPAPRRPDPRLRNLLIAGGVVFFAAVIGIGALLTSGGEPAARPSPSSAARPGSQQVYEYVPAVDRDKFTAALRKIDPGLVAHSERHLRRATSVCYKIYDGESDAAVLQLVIRSYDGGNSSVSRQTGERVRAAIERWICSSRDLEAHYRSTAGGG